ncbi:cell division protein FtsA (plasmid) [Rossellomorea sp. AcN35-11]|nr:cell division protein FtsA [Rossellomorea aquimaris]WJV32229.1 cell division protein FtsA [Rossellomorea sp. AcN35-11]
MAEKIYTCIDLGSSTIKVLLVKESRNRFVTVSTHKFESCGINKGLITNILEVSERLEDAVDKVERMTNQKIDEVFVGMGGLTTKSVECNGVISISNPEQIVTKEEIDRVLDAAKLTDMPSELEVVHVTPVEFNLDKVKHINDPSEMKGSRLEMNGMLGMANQTAIHSMRRAINNAGLEMKGLLLNPFALLEHLSHEDRVNGAWVIDIGGETVTISVVEKDRIQNIQVLGIGSDLITQDLGYAFHLKKDKANKLKHEVGLKNEVGSMRVQTKLGTAELDRKEVHHVIASRMEEILEKILDAIQESEVIIPSERVIFTGGGAAIEGFLEMAEEFFGRRATVLTPNNQDGNAAADFSAISGLIPLYFKNYGELDMESNVPSLSVDARPAEKESTVKTTKKKEKKEKGRLNKLVNMFFE